MSNPAILKDAIKIATPFGQVYLTNGLPVDTLDDHTLTRALGNKIPEPALVMSDTDGVWVSINGTAFSVLINYGADFPQ